MMNVDRSNRAGPGRQPGKGRRIGPTGESDDPSALGKIKSLGDGGGQRV
jgi:hypothetical protein